MDNETLHKCRISENEQFDTVRRMAIRRHVCVNEEPFQPLNGNGESYCLFHLPTDNKNVEKFEQVFNRRLDFIKGKLQEIGKLPFSDRKKAREEVGGYNFKCVWFPKGVYLREFAFNAPASFAGATFSGNAIFSGAIFRFGGRFESCTFTAQASFDSVVFSNTADFNNCKFLGVADFSSTDFRLAHFQRAKFAKYAGFPSSVFRESCSFDLADICQRADFSKARFLADFSGMSSKFGSTFFTGSIFRQTCDLSDALFHGSVSFEFCKFFKDASFPNAKFEKHALFNQARFYAESDFASAHFNDLVSFDSGLFSQTSSFNGAHFDGVSSFIKVTFGLRAYPDFSNTKFRSDAYFDETRFYSEVDFNSSIFDKDSDMLFRSSSFSGYANSRYCTSEGYLRFSKLEQRKEFSFDFYEAAFEKASRVSFDTMSLHPSWFLNVDSRKFVFTEIYWININRKFRNANILSELAGLKPSQQNNLEKRLFEITARQLAVNAEENNRYEEASKFRYLAMETRRLDSEQSLSASRILTFLYKWSSGYGESWSWAAFILFCILGFFALAYNSPFATFQESEAKLAIAVASNYESTVKMDNSDGLVYSLLVATLQKPEPKPKDNLTRSFVLLETIIAPLQAALLALAIRRKFMR